MANRMALGYRSMFLKFAGPLPLLIPRTMGPPWRTRRAPRPRSSCTTVAGWTFHGGVTRRTLRQPWCRHRMVTRGPSRRGSFDPSGPLNPRLRSRARGTGTGRGPPTGPVAREAMAVGETREGAWWSTSLPYSRKGKRAEERTVRTLSFSGQSRIRPSGTT